MKQPNKNGKSMASLVIQITTIVIVLVGAVSAPLILMYAHGIAIDERMSEVETQFKALDQLHNQALAQQMRVNALLWRRTYGEEWPNEIYFPEISKRK